VTEPAQPGDRGPDTRASDTSQFAIPAALVEAIRSGGAFLVAGPETPLLCGLPGRRAVLRTLIESAGRTSPTSERVLSRLEQGDLEPAVSLIRTSEWPVDEHVARIYGDRASISGYEALAQLPFAGLLNLGWDPGLLEAFERHDPTEVDSGWSEVLSVARSQEFAFTWVCGNPRTGNIALGPRELRMRLRDDETLSRFLTGIVQSSPLILLGGSASDFFDFLDALPGAVFAGAPRFAICPMDELWEVNQGSMRQFGVELVGYDPDDAGVLPQLVDRLAKSIDVGFFTENRGGQSGPSTLLTRITLTNIGVFEQLDLALTSGWNLLLGNNGCGKSTVLRAVALGLCGDHPSAVDAGARLLRLGSDHGLIELQVGASLYRTELRRTTSGTVRVQSTSLTPLQQGSWAVLGFPALRGMSLLTPVPTSTTKAPEPRVEDLLPLLRNEVDQRLDDVKQWIVNIDAQGRSGNPERTRQLLDRFFAVLGELTPGATLELGGIETDSFEVRIRTDDGLVSIDQPSQGMSSIIAWVGTLLQRMYDIFDDRPTPSTGEAFVLIDELDAHLHPEWQRLLPGLARQHFPNVQYLATSHSPLVAGSLQPGEIFVASRALVTSGDGSERLVSTVVPVDIDPKGLRVDQILTSPLFSLMTTRSPEFHNDAGRYDELLTKPARTEDEEAELQRLRSFIATSYRDGETVAQRERNVQEAQELDLALSRVPLDDDTEGRVHELTSGLNDREGEEPN
jgi:energy-coupling factor transporter ATP-binding protein EcfA2